MWRNRGPWQPDRSKLASAREVRDTLAKLGSTSIAIPPPVRRWSHEVMTIEIISLNRSHGGTQGVYRHASRETGTDMTFSVYVPSYQGEKLPVVWYLSGLTCTHANVTEKGEFRKSCDGAASPEIAGARLRKGSDPSHPPSSKRLRPQLLFCFDLYGRSPALARCAIASITLM